MVALRLQGQEFVRRFLLHILPSGVKLAAARAALQMPSNPQALESAQAFMARVAQIDGCCARVANWAGCAVLLCWWVSTGCLRRAAGLHPYLSAGGCRDALAQRKKSATVCRAI